MAKNIVGRITQVLGAVIDVHFEGDLPFLRPEGARTDQPRAERSGDSREAPPWGIDSTRTRALKERNKTYLFSDDP